MVLLDNPVINYSPRRLLWWRRCWRWWAQAGRLAHAARRVSRGAGCGCWPPTPRRSPVPDTHRPLPAQPPPAGAPAATARAAAFAARGGASPLLLPLPKNVKLDGDAADDSLRRTIDVQEKVGDGRRLSATRAGSRTRSTAQSQQREAIRDYYRAQGPGRRGRRGRPRRACRRPSA
ncbi:MAG: hypothetical protein WKG07_15010 [Hymenobacter sp.]